MKKFILQSFAVSVLSLVGSSAFAQENTKTEETKDLKAATDTSNSQASMTFSQDQIDALKKEIAKKDISENIVSFYGN